MKKFAALLTMLAVLTACGGGGGGRPSQDDIAKALKDKSNPVGSSFATAAGDAASDQVIDCIAKTLHDSDLSDGALNALVKGDKNYKESKDDDKALEAIPGQLAKCITS